MSDVRPRSGGPYSLYCYDCKRWIPNTANHEMQRGEVVAHGHFCCQKDGKTLFFGERGMEDLDNEAFDHKRIALEEREQELARYRACLNDIYPAIAGRVISLQDAGEEKAAAQWNKMAVQIYELLERRFD